MLFVISIPNGVEIAPPKKNYHRKDAICSYHIIKKKIHSNVQSNISFKILNDMILDILLDMLC